MEDLNLGGQKTKKIVDNDPKKSVADILFFQRYDFERWLTGHRRR
jgi:hypothetical protein